MIGDNKLINVKYSQILIISRLVDNSDTECSNSLLIRNLSLFDLVCIGVGSTVGSGVFVLTGYIANIYAGPSVIFSWIIAGIACVSSAMSYAELSCRIPSSGSSYSYVFVALGEWPAFIAAWCLTLEYGVNK